MRPYEYHVVDVFTKTSLEGNALAVFPDASGLDENMMQRIAREINLSETTFVFPPKSSDADAHVRIFAPTREMAFAGHPTLGTASVIRELGIVDREKSGIRLEEAVGIVPVRVENGKQPMFWLETPPIMFGEEYEREKVARAISVSASSLAPDIPCRLVTAGNPTLFVAMLDKDAVDSAAIESAAFKQLVAERHDPTCMFVFTPTSEGAYSRMFAPELGIAEDPATGSATGPLAAFMMRYGLAPRVGGTRLVSEQGTKMGRRSFLHVLIRGDSGSAGIEIGGYVAPFATATMRLSPSVALTRSL